MDSQLTRIKLCSTKCIMVKYCNCTTGQKEQKRKKESRFVTGFMKGWCVEISECSELFKAVH